MVFLGLPLPLGLAISCRRGCYLDGLYLVFGYGKVIVLNTHPIDSGKQQGYCGDPVPPDICGIPGYSHTL